jgi:sugar lactone lactonase YvrE
MSDTRPVLPILAAAALAACSHAAPPQSSGGDSTTTTTGAHTSGGTGSNADGGTTTGGSGGTTGSSSTGGSTGTSSTGGVAIVTTLSGASNGQPGNPPPGFKDGTGGPSGTSRFNQPLGVAVDRLGNIYVADTLNHAVRKLDASGNSSTLAGNGSPGFADGSGGRQGSARFSYPSGIAVDASNNVYVSDDGNYRVRKITPDGTTSTLAGTGVPGFVDGAGSPSGPAQLNIAGANLEFSGLCFDPHSNALFLADTNNNAIRRIELDGTVSTVAGNGVAAFIDGSGGRNGSARFSAPGGCAADSAGNLFIADSANCSIRKIDTAASVTTLSGNGSCASKDGSGGQAGTAELNVPQAVAVDAKGIVYATDTFDDLIRRIGLDGSMTTIGGAIGSAANGGGITGWRDGPGVTAEFDAPAGLALDTDGNLLITEFFGSDVRKFSFH